MFVSHTAKIPALPGIALGVLTAAIIGFALQGNTYEQAMSVAFNGYTSDTGVASVDNCCRAAA